jgi:hypothetical protein
MGSLNELLDGFISPLVYLIFSILIFELSKIVAIGYSIGNPSFSVNSIINIWTFVLIYPVISLVIELLSDVDKGYNHPIDSVCSIIGVIGGTVVFWGFFVHSLFSLVGTSTEDIIVSSILVIGSNLFGIFLRIVLVGRNYQSDYPYN